MLTGDTRDRCFLDFPFRNFAAYQADLFIVRPGSLKDKLN
jgi:hypothetical protein